MKRALCVALTAVFLAGAAPRPYPRSVPYPANFPPIPDTPQTITAADRTELVLHEWTPPQVGEERPIVLLIHGIGMHGAPYDAVSAGFTARGITFDALDLRGHGRSGGARGELGRPDTVRADIGVAVDAIHKQRPKAPIFLAGESMGGLLAADYAGQAGKKLAGLILLAPAFGVDHARLQGGGIFRISLDSKDKMAATVRDPNFIEARIADPLALHEVRLRYLITILMIQNEWPQAAPQLRLPVYIAVAGRDQVVDNAATRRVFDAVGTPRPDKVWRKWDDAYHALCWDPAAPTLIGEVAAWVLDREARR